MRRTSVALLVVMFVACASVAQDKWYPSKWGADDQRGAANRITPAKVLEARNLIMRGQTYQLGHVYESAMPLFGTRHYSLRIPKVFGPNGANQMYYHDEIISGELGQIGTQFDGLGHAGIGDLFYNGNKGSEFAKAEGLTKLGIENVGAIVTRGVLIDVAAYKGQPMLAGGYEITRADVEGALKRQNVVIRSGDVVIFHTGWGSLWIKDNAKFNANAPGIGLEAAQYLVDREIVMAGADTWSVEVVPNPDASLAFPLHQLFIAKNGIYIFENLLTEDLARDNVYEFAFIFAPLRLKGATGSPGNPLAIR
ncbi:MAG TPA: cyclase family protein [Vicinamibacterales bacterium]|jgi:kynurenine formamidase|nr:cyclase family protein [Vicinamibacterales bacterium]